MAFSDNKPISLSDFVACQLFGHAQGYAGYAAVSPDDSVHLGLSRTKSAMHRQALVLSADWRLECFQYVPSLAHSVDQDTSDASDESVCDHSPETGSFSMSVSRPAVSLLPSRSWVFGL